MSGSPPDQLTCEAGESFAASTTPPRRRANKLGRAARRRKKKLRDIDAAEHAIRSGAPSNQSEDVSCLPTDRDHVWPAVAELRKRSPIDATSYTVENSQWLSEEDQVALVGQLGYLPGNAIRIASRICNVPFLMESDGSSTKRSKLEASSPVVLQLYPLAVRIEHSGGKAGRRFKARKRKRVPTSNEGDEQNEVDQEGLDSGAEAADRWLVEPFPTMYWLTNPILRVLISKLEVKGFGSELERRLLVDSASMRKMERAHLAYGTERHSLLVDADLELINKRKWNSAFDINTRGVAGIRNRSTVKCLHAHAAHFLSGDPGSSDNVVGEWVMEAVERLLKDAKNEAS